MASHSPDQIIVFFPHQAVLDTPTKHACDDPYQSTSKYLAGERIWRGRIEDMPVIKILHVCSVSSEDPSHQADNLLNLETYRKWKCASAGEKKAVVVLQLEKSTQIQSIDIGNDGSAFIEVLVGRSTAPDSYEVLIGMSTFMTPQESKQWSNANRVRIFGKEKLSKTVGDQKWDRVKLVCTQPYNKNEKYGLSFVKLHSPPTSDDSAPSSSATTATETTSSSTTPPKLGRFTLKEETKDLPSGSLFFRKDTSKTSSAPSPSAAAKARMATAAALKATDQSDSISSSPATKQTDQSDSVVKSKVGGAGSSDIKRKRPMADSTPSKTASAGPPKRSKVSESKTDGSVPFDEIMSGVVFVLSGFKNPYRGELREKAMEMGAKYEADWNDSCTHLVCAFANTPKFNQVRGKHGLIVRKEWVLDSYSKRKRLPAKKYRLSSGNGDTSSSEEDRYDRKEAKIYGKSSSSSSASKAAADTTAKVATAKDSSKGGNEGEGEDPYGGFTDEDSDMDTHEAPVKRKPLTPSPTNEDLECDTEDEIERVRQKQSGVAADEEDDPYGGSTDEENGDESKPEQSGNGLEEAKSLLDLSDFFSNCSFLLYGSYSTADRRLLTRYITAYCGTIEEYMNEQVKYVITQEEWDDNFDKALTENSTLAFVRPKWIFVCHQKQKRIPYQPYAVVPH